MTWYPLKTRAIDMRQCIILRKIHQLSKIQRATQTQKPCYSITQCIRAAFVNIFVANISAPSFWKRFAKFFSCENFATYGITQLVPDSEFKGRWKFLKYEGPGAAMHGLVTTG